MGNLLRIWPRRVKKIGEKIANAMVVFLIISAWAWYNYRVELLSMLRDTLADGVRQFLKIRSKEVDS